MRSWTKTSRVFYVLRRKEKSSLSVEAAPAGGRKMELLPYLRPYAEGTLLDIYVQPKSSKNQLVGMHQGSLKIRLTAPPVDGEANKECVKFLAKLLGIPKSDIQIVQGHKSRRKTLSIRGMSPEAVQSSLNAQEDS